MSSHMTRFAPVLLATLLASLVTGLAVSPLRADPPAAPATTVTEECLAKPNASSPAGSHWYYRIDRQTGRRCWHLRQHDAKAGQDAKTSPTTDQRESASTRSVNEHTNRQAQTPSGERANSSNGASTSVAPFNAPGYSTDWLIAPAAKSGHPQASGAEQSAPTMAADSHIDTRTPDKSEEPTPESRIRAPNGERPVPSFAAKNEHLPALLGITLAVAVIVLASLIVRSIARLFRRKRHRATFTAPEMQRSAPHPSLHDVLQAASRPAGKSPRSAPIAEPNRDPMRALERDVRQLLQRVQTGRQAKPPADASSAARSPRLLVPSAPTQPSATGELTAALASWRQTRR